MESENECEEEGLREADGPGGLREAEGPGGLREAEGPGGLREADGPGGLREADGPGGLREADGPGGLREADGREGRKGYAKLKYKYWCIQKAVFDLFNRGVTKGRFHQHYNNYLTFMIVSFALANFGHALEAFVEQLIHVHATGPNVFDNPHARVEMMRD
jgi:hypothetical protein